MNVKEYGKLLNDKVITIDEYYSKCEKFIKNQPPFITNSISIILDNNCNGNDEIKHKLIIYKTKSGEELVDLIKKDEDFYMIAKALEIKDKEAFLNQYHISRQLLMLKKFVSLYKKINSIDGVSGNEYSDIFMQNERDKFNSLVREYTQKKTIYEELSILYRKGYERCKKQ